MSGCARIANMNRRRYLQVATFACLIFLLIQHLCGQTPVVIRVDAGRSLGPLNPVWNYFGYDEPNYTYAQHGRELIAELSASNAARVQIRTHNLLTTGDGT